MNNLNRITEYTIYLVYNDFTYLDISKSVLKVNFNISNDSKISLRFVEEKSMLLNYSDIDYILFDVGSKNETHTRKCFEVDFNSFDQEFEMNKSKFLTFDVKFLIKKFNIYQDNTLIDTASFIRSLKIKGVI